MSLFEDAALELREIINDDLGASLDCTIKSPDGIILPFVCRMSDISQSVDPGTRERVSGRQIVISVSMLDLVDCGFEGVRGVSKESQKPWVVSFKNIAGVCAEYKVAETAPDNTLGLVVLHLELFK